jgi:hypothetical protein
MAERGRRERGSEETVTTSSSSASAPRRPHLLLDGIVPPPASGVVRNGCGIVIFSSVLGLFWGIFRNGEAGFGGAAKCFGGLVGEEACRRRCGGKRRNGDVIGLGLWICF